MTKSTPSGRWRSDGATSWDVAPSLRRRLGVFWTADSIYMFWVRPRRSPGRYCIVTGQSTGRSADWGLWNGIVHRKRMHNLSPALMFQTPRTIHPLSAQCQTTVWDISRVGWLVFCVSAYLLHWLNIKWLHKISYVFLLQFNIVHNMVIFFLHHRGFFLTKSVYYELNKYCQCWLAEWPNITWVSLRENTLVDSLDQFSIGIPRAFSWENITPRDLAIESLRPGPENNSVHLPYTVIIYHLLTVRSAL